MIERSAGSRSGFASSRFWMIKSASGIFQGFLCRVPIAQMSLFQPDGRKGNQGGDQKYHASDPMKAPEDQQKTQVACDLVDDGEHNTECRPVLASELNVWLRAS